MALGGRAPVVGWSCGFNLSNNPTSHRPESSLHDHFRLFRGAQQSLLSHWQRASSGARRDCLLRSFRSIDPVSLWLSIRQASAGGVGGVDVSDDAVAAVSASVRDSPFLPVLPAVGGGDHHADGNRIGGQKLENRRSILSCCFCEPIPDLPRLTLRC